MGERINPEEIGDRWLLYRADWEQSFLAQSWSSDALVHYEFDESFDSSVLEKTRRDSGDNCRELLFELIDSCFRWQRYSALNMLAKVGVSLFGMDDFKRYSMNFSLDYDEALCAAASIDDVGFRGHLFGKWGVPYLNPKKMNNDTQIGRLLSEAHVVNHFMREHLLGFHEVRVMMGPSANVSDAHHWIQVYRRPEEGVGLSLTSDAFTYILSMLLGVDQCYAEKIYEAIIAHIFERQPPGMNLQQKLDVFGLFKPAVQSSDFCLGNDRPVAYQKH